MTAAMHLILKYPPHRLWCRNIASINIFLDLISTFSWIVAIQYNGRAIASLVDVFVKVFKCANAAADLHINVSIISFGEIRIIRNDPSVIEFYSIRSDKGSSIVRSLINWITIVAPYSVFRKRFGIFLRTFPFFMQGARGLWAPQGPCIINEVTIR